jgi:dihydroneopterin aldolase
MTDVIRIRDLSVETRIGVSDEERAHPRRVTINADLYTDTKRAGGSDDLGDTVDYGKAVTEVAALVRSTEARLIEHLAEQIAALLSGFKGVDGVTVEVVKDSPPVDEEVKAVSVVIERPGGGTA